MRFCNKLVFYTLLKLKIFGRVEHTSLAFLSNIRLRWNGLKVTHLQANCTKRGSVISNGREPQSWLGRVFNSKLGRMSRTRDNFMVYKQSILE